MATEKKKASLGKTISIAILALILFLGYMIYTSWYQFAHNGEDPYDEVFISINGKMPSFARDWACGRIAERFPGTIPPYTCQ